MGYANIFIMKLGANPVQLGWVNSIAGLSRTIISVPLGWLQDRYSLRKIFLFGVGVVSVVPLIYALASDWIMIVPAIIITNIAPSTCVVICNVCLESGDRATGKALCEAIGSIPSLFSPLLAAFLITYFGGISVGAIRPLYWIQFAGGCVFFFFAVIRLTEIERIKVERKKSSFLGDFRVVFERGTALKRFLLLYALHMFTISMITPFRAPFAHEIKGAEQFVIGGMAVAATLTQVLFATPLGRLSDKIGRKKVFYALTPIVCASNLLFVFSPSPEILIISALLFGFRMIIRLVAVVSMYPELVPIECTGRWRGIVYLLGGLASIPAPIVGGIIWESLGPAYIFLLATIIDLLLIPIISTIPETLKLHTHTQ
jgi:MFS family permease